MRSPLIAVFAVIGALAAIWLLFLAAFATYDAIAGRDAMDDMWDMMRSMGGMMDHGDSMNEMMRGMMGRGNQPQTTGSAAGQGEVRIQDFNFVPSDLTVTPGTTVRWANEDTAPHTATARDKSFDSGKLDKNGSFQMKFEKAGTFPYYCVFHPWMEGKIVVQGQ